MTGCWILGPLFRDALALRTVADHAEGEAGNGRRRGVARGGVPGTRHPGVAAAGRGVPAGARPGLATRTSRAAAAARHGPRHTGHAGASSPATPRTSAAARRRGRVGRGWRLRSARGEPAGGGQSQERDGTGRSETFEHATSLLASVDDASSRRPVENHPREGTFRRRVARILTQTASILTIVRTIAGKKSVITWRWTRADRSLSRPPTPWIVIRSSGPTLASIHHSGGWSSAP